MIHANACSAWPLGAWLARYGWSRGKSLNHRNGNKVDCHPGVCLAKLSTQGTNRSPHSLRPFPLKPLRYLCCCCSLCSLTYTARAPSSPDFPTISGSISACYLSFQLAMAHATCPGVPSCHSNHAHSCPYRKTAHPPSPLPRYASPVSTYPKKKNPRRHIPVGLASLWLLLSIRTLKFPL